MARKNRYVIGFTGPYRNRKCLFVHLSGNPRPKWYNRWQRPFYKALTLDLIRGCYCGKYSIYDIF